MTVPDDAPTDRPDPAAITRIGTDERTSAMQALDIHLNAGRLDAEEYGERVGRVSVARTRADLEPLFTDLPAPHPRYLPIPRTSPPVEARRATVIARKPDSKGRVALGGHVGESVVAASPFIAVILFFAFNGVFDQAWLFFLLVPLAGAIVYGRNRRGD